MTNVKVLKETIKKWVHEYNILDACLELTQGKIIDLKSENEQLKNCLQEIKAIAEENKDTVQYGGICRSILMIITKAEEE